MQQANNSRLKDIFVVAVVVHPSEQRANVCVIDVQRGNFGRARKFQAGVYVALPSETITL